MEKTTKKPRRRVLDRLTAARIMSSPVAVVRETASIREAARVMARRRISAVAVLDGDGKVSGLLAAADIVRFQPRHACRVLDGRMGYHVDCIGDVPVKRVMTQGLYTVPPSAPAEEIARRMTENSIHRLIVADKGRVVGIITAFDLARCLWLARPGAVGDVRMGRLDPSRRGRS